MPQGIDVLVEDGFATIDIVDRSLFDMALNALIKHTPRNMIVKQTRVGPRTTYRVPEGNARAAGLLDIANYVSALPKGDSGYAAALAEVSPATGHFPFPTVKGNAYVNGRDGANGAIQGPLRPNQPVAETVPSPPAGATVATSALQDYVRSNPFDHGTPKPAEAAVPVDAAVPDETWKVDDLRAYARDHKIDLDGATKKVDVLAKIRGE